MYVSDLDDFLDPQHVHTVELSILRVEVRRARRSGLKVASDLVFFFFFERNNINYGTDWCSTFG